MSDNVCVQELNGLVQRALLNLGYSQHDADVMTRSVSPHIPPLCLQTRRCRSAVSGIDVCILCDLQVHDAR